MRLIDADELRNELTSIYSDKVNDYNKAVKAFIEFIDNAPTVCNDNYAMGYQDGVRKVLSERPQGEWINREAVSNTTFPFWERYECNKCHLHNGYSNFCPNCGADMRGGK